MKSLMVVTGHKRSGKDTFGDYLVHSYGYKKAQPFACFKPAIKDWFGFSEEQMNGSLKEVRDPRWGLSPREIMQVFGTELMREDLPRRLPEHEKVVGKKLWALIFRDWYLRQPDGQYVVCDWRFPEEQDAIKDLPNVRFIKIINSRVLTGDMHSSESGIDQLPAQYGILNEGTLDEYYNNIDMTMWLINQDILGGRRDA